MATKKTTEEAKTSAAAKAKAVKKPESKPKAAVKKPSVTKKAAPKKTPKKAAAKTAEPVVITPPKPKTKPALKAAASDAVDAEVISSTTVTKPSEKPATPKAAAKSGSPSAEPASPKAVKPAAAGSLVKIAVLGGAAVIAIVVLVSVVGKLNGTPSVPAVSVEKIEELKTSADARFDQLETAIAGLNGGEDGGELGAVQSGIKNLKAAMNMSEAKTKSKLKRAGDAVTALEVRLAAAEEKLAAPAATPVISAAPDTETAALIAGYGEQLQVLQQQIAAQNKANADLVARLATLESGQTELQSAKAEVVELTVAVQGNTDETDLALALSGLTAAIQNGTAYGDHVAAIESLTESAVSNSLKDSAATGVKPLHVLQQDFPEAARVALKASLKAEGGDSAAAKFTAFVKSQISARSLEERAGEDPDALLSQAEAALGRGRLKTAVSLVKKLPEEGVLAMQVWLDAAQARLRAEVALKRLAQALASDE